MNASAKLETSACSMVPLRETKAKCPQRKRVVGRPTVYDSKYCDMIVADMSEGFSLSAFAGFIGVSRPTLNNWMGKHDEFFEAVSRAKAACLRSWERRAIDIAEKGGGQGSATLVMFALKNMGGEEWREKQEAAHSSVILLGDLVAASSRIDKPYGIAGKAGERL